MVILVGRRQVLCFPVFQRTGFSGNRGPGCHSGGPTPQGKKTLFTAGARSQMFSLFRQQTM